MKFKWRQILTEQSYRCSELSNLSWKIRKSLDIHITSQTQPFSSKQWKMIKNIIRKWDYHQPSYHKHYTQRRIANERIIYDNRTKTTTKKKEQQLPSFKINKWKKSSPSSSPLMLELFVGWQITTFDSNEKVSHLKLILFVLQTLCWKIIEENRKKGGWGRRKIRLNEKRDIS